MVMRWENARYPYLFKACTQLYGVKIPYHKNLESGAISAALAPPITGRATSQSIESKVSPALPPPPPRQHFLPSRPAAPST